jgi:hypothetical protein
MRSLDDILKYALEPPPPLPPSQYEIALRLSCALIASGRFGENPEAAIGTAWAMVNPFYQGVKLHKEQTNMFFDMAQHASQPEDRMSVAEARAYVGGEAGADPGGSVMHRTMTEADLEKVQEKQRRISAALFEVQRTRVTLDMALARDNKKKIEEAQKDFDAACKVQSAAYED